MADSSTATVTSSKTNTSGSTHTETRYATSQSQETVVHELSDNGSGGLGDLGTVNYGAKTANVRFVDLTKKSDGYKSDYEDAQAFQDDTGASGTGGSSTAKGGEYTDNAVSEQVLSATTVTATYAKGFGVEINHTYAFLPPAIVIDLLPFTNDYIVPGSVRFTWMQHVYEDYDGVLVRGRNGSDPGTVCGHVNYSAGTVEIFDWVVVDSPLGITITSLWTVRQNWTTASIFMRTQSAPLKPGSYVMNLSDTQGNAITAMADNSGNITGTHLRGRVEFETGIVELQFGDLVLDSSLTAEQKLEWWYNADDVGAIEALKIWRPWPVDPTTLRYNSVVFFYLPIDADILGLDPVRLPQDGRVPIYRQGGQIVISNVAKLAAATYTNGQTVNCGRERLSRVRIFDSTGAVIETGYTVNLDTGIVTIVSVSGWSQPVQVEHRIEQMMRVSDVQIDGTLPLVGQLAHNFPIGSVVSSALVVGDMRARVSAMWDQLTWSPQVWSDVQVGDGALANYNSAGYPIILTNVGAMTQRFALRFKNGTTFECIGEFLGNLGDGSINVDYSPVNPLTGEPYFTIKALGWGVGWSQGNVVFIHTKGAIASFAEIRTVQMGPPAGIDYSFEVIGRGSIDRPPSA